jgi:hypothetical protein
MDGMSTTELPDHLAGVPGIGSARRALLAAAGIVSRADLARASVEQIVSVTGMPRAAAARALEAVLADRGALSAPPAPSEDEAFPAAAEEAPQTPSLPDAPPLDAVPSPEEEAVAPATELERAVFAARTALSDATRLAADLPRLDRALTRFALLLDQLAVRLSGLKPGVQRRVTRRLLRVTARLEKVGGGALGPRRAERLRERLRAERREIAALVRPAGKQRRRDGKGRR